MKAAVSIPIIEHVADFADTFAVALIAQRAVDAFNVVPVQAGGPTRALRLIQLAEAAGMDALLGSTVELSPGTSMALHVGAASAGITMASDLVGPGRNTRTIHGCCVRVVFGYRETLWIWSSSS